jgi:hypothetical protein
MRWNRLDSSPEKLALTAEPGLDIALPPAVRSDGDGRYPLWGCAPVGSLLRAGMGNRTRTSATEEDRSLRGRGTEAT